MDNRATVDKFRVKCKYLVGIITEQCRPEANIQLGITKVFLQQADYDFLQRIMKIIKNTYAHVLTAFCRRCLKSYLKLIGPTLALILQIQTAFRRYLVYKQYTRFRNAVRTMQLRRRFFAYQKEQESKRHLRFVRSVAHTVISSIVDRIDTPVQPKHTPSQPKQTPSQPKHTPVQPKRRSINDEANTNEGKLNGSHISSPKASSSPTTPTSPTPPTPTTYSMVTPSHNGISTPFREKAQSSPAGPESPDATIATGNEDAGMMQFTTPRDRHPTSVYKVNPFSPIGRSMDSASMDSDYLETIVTASAHKRKIAITSYPLPPTPVMTSLGAQSPTTKTREMIKTSMVKAIQQLVAQAMRGGTDGKRDQVIMYTPLSPLYTQYSLYTQSPIHTIHTIHTINTLPPPPLYTLSPLYAQYTPTPPYTGRSPQRPTSQALVQGLSRSPAEGKAARPDRYSL